jgi:hypothetical protein
VWLADRLAEDVPTIVGIDHGFSFPLRYFEVHQLEPDWPKFLEDLQRHWPTDAEHTYVDFVRVGLAGNGAARAGNTRWRRMTEQRAGSAKSVFHFDVQGSVAKSTHAGIPWLLYLRRHLGSRLHFWPFDGWSIPSSKSAVVEVYPSLWKHAFPADDRTPDQHDAYVVASWLSEADRSGRLERFLQPNLTLPERMVAGGGGLDPGRRVNRGRRQEVGIYRPRYTAAICSLSCPSSALILVYGAALSKPTYARAGVHAEETAMLALIQYLQQTCFRRIFGGDIPAPHPSVR